MLCCKPGVKNLHADRGGGEKASCTATLFMELKETDARKKGRTKGPGQKKPQERKGGGGIVRVKWQKNVLPARPS